MKTIIVMILTMAPSTLLWASTFVGNGGNAGDVELLVAKKQVSETFQMMLDLEVDNDELCKCVEEYQNDNLCVPLNSLNDKQQKYCVQVLNEKAKGLVDLVDTEGKVNFQWTHQAIEVIEGKKRRAVDAVADRDKMEITINQSRFLEMSPTERIFLLTHELFHFTEINGKPLTDEGPLGPFTGNEGSRNFINAAAAATAMQAVDNKLIRKYRSQLRRPQGWRKNWIDFSFGDSSSDVESGSTYATGDYSNVGIGYRHYWGNLGVSLNYSKGMAQKTILTTIKADEEYKIFGAGINYRVFLFSNPLSRFGQSYLDLHVQIQSIEAKYQLRDTYVNLLDSDKKIGQSIGINYYFPLWVGLWATLGLNYSSYAIEFPQLGIKYGSSNSATLLGVSYGF